MDPHVSIEVSWLRKAEQTKFALIRLLARMNPHVLGKCRRVWKGLFAHPATVRPFSRMRPHVSCDGRTLWETTIANLTTERFLARMCSNVSRQIGCLTEWFVTVTATIRTFTRMGSHMRLKCAGPSVRFATNSAQVGFTLADSSTCAASTAARYSASARGQFSIVVDGRSQTRSRCSGTWLPCLYRTLFRLDWATTSDTRISFRWWIGWIVILLDWLLGFGVVFAASSATERTWRWLFELLKFVETRWIRCRPPIAGQTVASCRWRCKWCRVNIWIVRNLIYQSNHLLIEFFKKKIWIIPE